MGLDSLTNVKTRLGISGSTYDVFLQNQIDLVSDAIEGYCGRKFNQATWDQTFYRGDYRMSGMLELYHFPLISVAYLNEDDVELDSDYYRIHKPTGRIILTNHGQFFWAQETVVRYVAGYVTVPSLILSVLDSIVQERYNKKSAGIDLNFGSDVQRISIPGAISIDFDYTLNNNERKSTYGTILGSQMNVLDPWRSERAVLGTSTLHYVDDSAPAPTLFGTYDSPITVTASGGITSGVDQAQAVFVKSVGGEVAITANPQISAGARVGQTLVIEGTSDDDFITLANGNGLALAGPITMIDRQTLNLFWDGFVWVETGRN